MELPPPQRRLKRDTEAEHAEITVELSIKINIPRPGWGEIQEKEGWIALIQPSFVYTCLAIVKMD